MIRASAARYVPSGMRPSSAGLTTPPRRGVVLSRARKVETPDEAEAEARGGGAGAEAVAEIARRAAEELADIAAHSELVKNAPELNVEHVAGSLPAKVGRTASRLEHGLLERETEVRLLLLAALAGEHLLLLGPPGTAKSELARRLSDVTSGKFFERLLTRFSVPEELFGPLSMSGLANDKYHRQVEGYLPTAEVAFVDEIFKANSAILNALLTLLNERLFDNGTDRHKVPLLCLVGASNELPESEELDALYDRFLLRKSVKQVSADGLGDLAALAASGFAGATAPEAEDDRAHYLAMDDLLSCRDEAIARVEVSRAVIDLLVGLRKHLQDKCEPPVYVSDRRFIKCVQLLQVAAHANGADAVSVYDCILLQHALGQRPGDDEKVLLYVLDAIAKDPGLTQAELAVVGAYGAAHASLSRDGDVGHALEEARTLVALLRARHASLSATLDAEFPLLRSNVWLSAPDISAAIQHIAPLMAENKERVAVLLEEALTLEQALLAPCAPSVLESLLPRRHRQYAKGVQQA